MSSSKELVVSQSRHETKVAILEDGQLVEVYFQRANEYSLAGSIHKGRVTRVLPGMQSAFVDLGLDRDCFLYVSDFWEEHGEDVERVDTVRRSDRDRDRDRDRRGGRERDRDRGRDRDRDREREQRPLEEAPELPIAAWPVEPGEFDAVPIQVNFETGEAAAPPEPPEDALAESAPENGAEGDNAAGDMSQDRRRRSRRRRRGGRGFPEAKYAGQGSEPEPQPAAPASHVPVIEPQPKPAPVPPVQADVFILPGESLAKYRRKAEQRPAPPPPVVEPEPEPEPDASLVVDATDVESPEEMAERVLDRVEEIEAHDSGAAVDQSDDEPEPDEEIDAGSSPVDDVETEADTETGAEAEGEPEAEGEVDADSEAGPDAEGEADATGETPEEGVEPARMPQSLTATLRAQGDRLPRRLSRRRRRRGGRPGQEGMPEAVRAAGAETAEVVQPEPPARVEDRERDRDRDREHGRRAEGERPRTPAPSISELLKEGQEIIVQIAKEPLGQKGARITSHIALPGRYVVYMPTVDHLGVSRKISTEEERQRLKRILQKHREGMPGGFIMRTAGEGKSEEDVANDMQYLGNLWLDIRQKAEKRRAPALLHHDVEVVQRLLRDHLNEGFKAIWVDSEELYEGVLHSVERLQPALLARVKMYTRPEPIFDAFGITGELEKALRPKVWLKSGGYIVLNQTEALVAIDVNTGKYVGKSNRLEDTIVRTNLEAVKEISRQVRLRDLGGIIVVDFIDMDERKNRQKVMQALEEAMRADKAPYKILQFNDFGLVAITRKRVKQSLERTLCAPCPYCEGAGYVKSVPTVISEILVQAQKYAKVADTKEVVLRVSPEVAKELKSVETKYLEEVEEILGRPVLVAADDRLHMEKFDLT